MAVMGAPRVRSATAKNSAMAIAAGLIWRAIFVFIGIGFYLFLREIFPGAAKIFRNRNFFVAELHGLPAIATQSEAKRKPLSNIAFTT
jgi:hypothetical protein